MPKRITDHEHFSAVFFAATALVSFYGNITLPGVFLVLKLFDYDIVLATFLESHEGDEDVGLDRDD